MTERAVVQTIVPKGSAGRRAWWKFTLLAALLAAVFSETMLSLVRIWVNRPDYSHGFLIPLISAYFIWADRDRIRALELKPALAAGGLLVLLGSLLFLLGSAGNISILRQSSLVILVPGFVLLFAGREYLKQLSLPIAYLIFMIPVLDIIFDNIRMPFQLFSAVVAAKFLHLFDVLAFQTGNFIELPGITLEVARACSGVQYLVSIIAIGIPLAYFTQKTWKFRISLILSAVMIGIFINPVRITLIGLWSAQGGEDLHGPLHIFQGLFVSVAGYCMLFVLAFLFSRIAPRETVREAPILPVTPRQMSTADPGQLTRAWSISMIFMLGLAGYHYFHEIRPVPIASTVKSLPHEIGAWRGALVHGATGYAAHGADAEIRMQYHYQGRPDRKISLYAGYFASQGPDKKIVDYRLQRLFDLAEPIRIPTGSGPSIEINKAALMNNGKRELVLFWYDLNGRIIAGNAMAKMVSLYDAVVNGRSNGALIIVGAPIENSDDTSPLLDSEIEFVQAVLPALRDLLSAGSDA